VKMMRSTPEVTRASPTAPPGPSTTWRRPSGRPALAMTSPMRRAVKGVWEEGFSTTALPAARAIMVCEYGMARG